MKRWFRRAACLILSMTFMVISTSATAASDSVEVKRAYLENHGVDQGFLQYMQDADIEEMYASLHDEDFVFSYSESYLDDHQDGIVTYASPRGLKYLLGFAMVLDGSGDKRTISRVDVTSIFSWDAGTPGAKYNDGELITINWEDTFRLGSYFSSEVYKRNSAGGNLYLDSSQSLTNPAKRDLTGLYYRVSIDNTYGCNGTAKFSLYPNGTMTYYYQSSGRNTHEAAINGYYYHKTTNGGTFNITLGIFGYEVSGVSMDETSSGGFVRYASLE